MKGRKRKKSAPKTVDPETGERSNREDAIPYTTWYARKFKRKKVDRKTGKPSDGPDAIPYTTWYKSVLVSPKTGKPSEEKDAIPRGQLSKYSHKKVDPDTGKPSDRPDAIPYTTWYNRRLVHPITGEPSNEEGAISRSSWYFNKYNKGNTSGRRRKRKKPTSTASDSPKVLPAEFKFLEEEVPPIGPLNKIDLKDASSIPTPPFSDSFPMSSLSAAKNSSFFRKQSSTKKARIAKADGDPLIPRL